jgi:flagellar biosynthesis/type III secretory pathway chaperone
MKKQPIPVATLDNFISVCSEIALTLEREHALLRGRNSLLADGVDELEEIQSSKDEQIATLDKMTKSTLYSSEAQVDPVKAAEVRQVIEHCKKLQARNHQVFTRIVAAQKRIIEALVGPEPDELVSLYNPRGRSADYGGSRRAGFA